ncbi:hypothetical protein A3K63_03300 [Candidatus Micrarchaeota archaeon RBG_16_49_10]|nr:MAG: hypothetical protein A3K63_03300 [Candidatus Micrarchaeota archaeon RBG_16_49_10]
MYVSEFMGDLTEIKNKIRGYNPNQLIFYLDDEHRIKLNRRKITLDDIKQILFDTDKIMHWEKQTHRNKKVRHRVTYKRSNKYSIVVVFELRKNKIIMVTAWPRDINLTKQFKTI